MSKHYMADKAKNDYSEVSDEDTPEEDNENTEDRPLLDNLDKDKLAALESLTSIATALMPQMQA